MKRILTIIGCVIVLAAASSCTKKYVTTNDNLTVYADVPASAWTLFTDPSGVKSYSASINVNQLSNNFADVGGIIVSISYTNGVYEQIPEVYAGTSFSYTYNGGNLTIYAQSPDGTKAVLPTDPIKVKIVLVSSSN